MKCIRLSLQYLVVVLILLIQTSAVESGMSWQSGFSTDCPNKVPICFPELVVEGLGIRQTELNIKLRNESSQNRTINILLYRMDRNADIIDSCTINSVVLGPNSTSEHKCTFEKDSNKRMVDIGYVIYPADKPESNIVKNKIIKPAPDYETPPAPVKQNTPASIAQRYSPEVEIIDDFGLSKFNESLGKQPRSEWYLMQQKLYWELLKNSQYDVLVVPFQVHLNGIDRAGRSLMTRYLVDYIERTTNYKVANPTLVARALGERKRRFNLNELYGLAHDLNAKFLIMGYVGHDQDQSVKLKILFRENDYSKPHTAFYGVEGWLDDPARYGGKYPAELFEGMHTAVDMLEIPFTDEQLPSEGFRKMLAEVVSKLPLEFSQGKHEQSYERMKSIPMPQNIEALLNGKDKSSILNAYHLQLLGILYPEKTVAMEQLFERSLIALQGISPKSPDYALLKARALFYLNRRPAALEALGVPGTPEEKAFLAFLNGNIQDLKKFKEEIVSPLHKFISEVEYNDLRFYYSGTPASKAYVKGIFDETPGWLQMFLVYRLYRDYVWFVQSNAMVKAELDKAFPLEGKTLKELATKGLFSGKFLEGEEIEFSVYNHVHRLIAERGEKYYPKSDSINPSKGDYIDILDALGYANLLHALRVKISAQGLYEEAKKTVDRYEIIYEGHPVMTFMKALALDYMPDDPSDVANDKRFNHKIELFDHAYFWFQGQEEFPANMFSLYANYYKFDFPAKPPQVFNPPLTALNFYTTKIKDTMIAEAIKKLNDFQRNQVRTNYHKNKYTNYDFVPLSIMLDIFEKAGMNDLAKALDDENRNRFKGNPQRYTRLIEKKLSASDLKEVKTIYKEFKETAPEDWTPYYGLGGLLIIEGNFKGALDIFQSYPLFNEKESRDAVALSNYAYEAGLELLRGGGLDESVAMFKLSESYPSGSESQMSSSAKLSIINGNYAQALLNYYRMASRYGGDYGYGFLISMLHLTGQHEDARDVLAAITVKNRPDFIFRAIMMGRRMEQKSQEETHGLLFKREDLKKSKYFPLYLALDGCTDRTPDEGLLKWIYRVDSSPGYVKPSDAELAADFVRGYMSMRSKDYAQAYQIFSNIIEISISNEDNNRKRIKESAYPYAVVSAVRSGKASELTDLRKRYEKFNAKQRKFFVHLADAYELGMSGSHKEAMEKLKEARYSAPWMGERLMFPIYQIIEIAELLYESTGYDEYRKLAVEWARYEQRIYPMHSWAYAMEAKLTDSEADRLRALALTLYLDENSERISHFSEGEKKKALQWLEHNNPFVKKLEKQRM